MLYVLNTMYIYTFHTAASVAFVSIRQQMSKLLTIKIFERVPLFATRNHPGAQVPR